VGSRKDRTLEGEVIVSSPAESLSGARLRFRRFFLPIFRGCGRLERVEKPTRDPGDVVDGRIESGLVRLGWFGEAADLPDELQRCGENLFLRDRWFNVEERLNVSTHLALPLPRYFCSSFPAGW
jgi:hypothetical protein